MPVTSSDLLTHNETYHTEDGVVEDGDDLPSDYISPYRFLRVNKLYVCVMGCDI